MKKFPIIILFFLFIKSQFAYCQNFEDKIKKADSLFNLKKYTQAYDIYERLYSENKIYTHQMLVKMAFIQEGLENYSKTLFYLNNYFLLTNDKNAFEKIGELARKNNLEGYEYSDANYFMNLFRYYKPQITFLFVLLISILVIWIIYTKYRHQKVLKIPAFITIFVLLIFLVTNLFTGLHTSAIVSKNSFLMSGPSAGAYVVGNIEAGNKVIILDNEDIWLKIRVNEKTGYLKKHNVLKLL